MALPPPPNRFIGYLIAAMALGLIVLMFQLPSVAPHPSVVAVAPQKLDRRQHVALTAAPPLPPEPSLVAVGQTARPASPSVTSSPELPPTPTAQHGTADAPSQPDSLQRGPWKEAEISSYQPQISVTNQSYAQGFSCRLLLKRNGSILYQWDIQDALETTIEAGEYDYELDGIAYARSGEPDCFGKLRCYHHRGYSIGISLMPDTEDRHIDLGDP